MLYAIWNLHNECWIEEWRRWVVQWCIWYDHGYFHVFHAVTPVTIYHCRCLVIHSILQVTGDECSIENIKGWVKKTSLSDICSQFFSLYSIKTWKILSLPNIITRVLCWVGTRVFRFSCFFELRNCKTKFHLVRFFLLTL